MRDSGLATLLLDLLTDDEEGDRRNVFDIALLGQRLSMATAWTRQDPETASLAVAYFGASAGAAAALALATGERNRIAAVVSRGGRPDLAGQTLPVVKAPTLLIVGGDDDVVLDLHRAAFAQFRCEINSL